MAGLIATKLDAEWKRALAASTRRPGFIGTIPYVLLIRSVVILIFVVQVAVSIRTGTLARDYIFLLLLPMAALGVAALDYYSEEFRGTTVGTSLALVFDVALISWLYFISLEARSDSFVLFALPLVVAADPFRLRSAALTLILVLGSFALVLHELVPATDTVRQFLAVFVPRSVFLTMLMAAWASAVRSLGIKERQLGDLTGLNDELSSLKTTDEIAKAVCLRAMNLTGAESVKVLKPLGESGPWPLTDPLLQSLIGTEADEAALLELLEKSERKVAVARLSKSNASGYRGVLATPIASHGHLFGILLLASRSRRALQVDSIKSLSRTIADQTATALDRAQILASWRMLLDALAGLAPSMPAAQLVLNADRK